LTLLTQGVIFMGYIGPSIQAIAEARGAAVDVFRLIDEVSSLNTMLITFSFSFFDLGKQ